MFDCTEMWELTDDSHLWVGGWAGQGFNDCCGAGKLEGLVGTRR